MLFFGGYGVQAGRESYMIPVDAAIWKEADVRREGVSIESVLDAMKEKGASAKLVVVDASRRNPYERRFRAYSHGLAPIAAPDNALILSSATPGKVADDSKGQHSVLMTELLNQPQRAGAGIESAFNKTRIAISRATDGEQVPSCRRRCWKTSASAADVAERQVGCVTANAGPDLVTIESGRSGRRSVARQIIALACVERIAVSAKAAVHVASGQDGDAVALRCPSLRLRAAVTGRTGSPSRSIAPARATTMSPSTIPPVISTWPDDINPTSTRLVSTRAAPHHLHHGAGAAVEDRGQRHRDAAALPGLDQSPGRGVDQQPPARRHPDRDLAELAVGLDGRGDPAHLARRIRRRRSP